jgi:SAM-dependent methyltransferase
MPKDSNLSFYDRFAGPYQHLYAQIDEDAAVDRWVGVLQKIGLIQGLDARQLAPIALVDVGCGAGKHLPAWKRQGFAPTGLDGSPAMLAYAERNFRSADLEFSLILADILALDGERRGASLFSAAVSHLFFPNLFSSDQLFFLMEGIACLLKPGGIWIADWRTDLLGSRPTHETVEIDGVSWRRSNAFDPAIEAFVQTWSTGDLQLEERFWHHELSQIEESALRAGLHLLLKKRFADTPSSLTLIFQK